jgi:hypothetical protein
MEKFLPFHQSRSIIREIGFPPHWNVIIEFEGRISSIIYRRAIYSDKYLQPEGIPLPAR